MVSLQPISVTSAYSLLPTHVVIICDLQRLALYWFTCLDCNWTTKFHSQRTNHMERSATSTTVTEPVGECLQAGSEDALVLDRLAPLRRFHDSGAGYKYPELLTYLLTSQSRHSSTDHTVAPATWNTLSDELRNPDLHSATFRCNLKTFLFRQYLAH